MQAGSAHIHLLAYRFPVESGITQMFQNILVQFLNTNLNSLKIRLLCGLGMNCLPPIVDRYMRFC